MNKDVGGIGRHVSGTISTRLKTRGRRWVLVASAPRVKQRSYQGSKKRNDKKGSKKEGRKSEGSSKVCDREIKTQLIMSK